MATWLFVLGGVGFALLPVFIVTLVRSFRMQQHVWDPFVSPSTVATLPRRGVYAIRVRTDNLRLGFPGLAVPPATSALFTIQDRSTGEAVEFRGGVSATHFSMPAQTFWYVGRFVARNPGDYWIASDPTNRFLPGQMLVVGRRPSAAALTALIAGISLSFAAGLAGVILGALTAHGTLQW